MQYFTFAYAPKTASKQARAKIHLKIHKTGRERNGSRNVNSVELTITLFLQIFSFILEFGAKQQSFLSKEAERFLWLKDT